MTTTTIIKTVFFDASRETVWSFLTDKDKLGAWYHPAEADLAEGEPYELYKVDDDGARARLIWGRVLKMQPFDKLVTTFCIAPFGGRETTVTWQLSESAGGTRLHLTHDGIADAAGEATLRFLKALDDGWDQHLGDLRKAAA
ncbi:MAG: SRPBCC family protein [Hyphomicrobiaceae bacterium]